MAENKRGGIGPIELPAGDEDEIDLFVSPRRFVGSTPSAAVTRDRLSSERTLSEKLKSQSGRNLSDVAPFEEDTFRGLKGGDVEKGTSTTRQSSEGKVQRIHLTCKTSWRPS
jgi:hypothetical protein